MKPPKTKTGGARVIVVSSGKGGVGKSFLSMSIAAELSARGQRVALFDGDLGLANLHLLLGINAPNDLSAVVEGRKTLSQIILNGPAGLRLVLGASGIRDMADLSEPQVVKLMMDMIDLLEPLEFLVVDTGAGIGAHVTTLAKMADLVMVVVRDEVASLADAYGLIKVLHCDFKRQNMRIVMNDVSSDQQAKEVFERLNTVSKNFIGLPLVCSGIIPHDRSVPAAARKRKLVRDFRSDSPASEAVRRLADSLLADPLVAGQPQA